MGGKEWILVIMQYLNLNNKNNSDDDKRPTWGSSIGWPHGNPNEVGFSLVKFSSIIGARSLQSFIVNVNVTSLESFTFIRSLHLGLLLYSMGLSLKHRK